MELVQLSREESFEMFVFRKLRALKSIILCEGVTEKMVIKRIVKKLQLDIRSAVGIIECGGIPHIYDYTSIISLLISIARKIHNIGVVVDGEDMDPQQRVESLISSIRARGIEVYELSEVEQQLYRARAVSLHRHSVDLYIAVNGVYSYDLDKHTIHDHGLALAYRMNLIDSNAIQTTRLAEDIINRDKLLELVEKASINDLKECFKHVVHMIKILTV